jgi:hypothetical protein
MWFFEVALLSLSDGLKLPGNITLQLFISATCFGDVKFSTMYFKYFSAVILFYCTLRTLQMSNFYPDTCQDAIFATSSQWNTSETGLCNLSW